MINSNKADKINSGRNIKKTIVPALKEIFFIVTGILIAFYINKWDADNKDNKKALEFIRDVNSDLKKDSLFFGSQGRVIDTIIKYQKIILETKSPDTFSSNGIIYLTLGRLHNVKLTDATYNRMKNSDIFHLPQYETLFKSINTYYSLINIYPENRSRWESTMYESSSNFLTFQNNFELNFDTSTTVLRSETDRQKKLLEFLASVQGRNIIKMSLAREQGMKEMYDEIYKSSKKLVMRTDSVIAKNN